MGSSNKDNLALLEAQAPEEEGLKLRERLGDEHIKDGVARRKARGLLHIILLSLLGFEIFFIAYVILSQGIKTLLFTHIPFALNEWAFALFINGVIIQTCFLIRPIALDLFPNGKSLS